MKKTFLKILSVSALSAALMACSSTTEKTSQSSQSGMLAGNSEWQIFEGDRRTYERVTKIVDMYANRIYNESDARGMAIIVIDNNQTLARYYGETAPGNGQKPGPNSLIRIASVSKLMTSEILIKLEQDKKLAITDPLQQYSYNGVTVPDNNSGQPIRLYHLASHTSGLPREQPGGKWGRPVFIWPTQENRWTWLKTGKLDFTPGTEAAYSNLAYDLLADAMVKATGQSYPQLFSKYVTSPAKMTDTTYTPSKGQCARLMEGTKPSPCHNTLAAAGSGGVYSTPADMQKWMQQFLSTDNNLRKATAAREQGIFFPREKLLDAKGMDVAGYADGLGLGWVYMKPKNGIPGIYQKTGGGGGFNTYMAMIPQQNIAVFVVMTRKDGSKFSKLTAGVNDMVASLSSNHAYGKN
ncbi:MULTISPECIES: D-alanyl-D-alanine-carboxypeptidase/endopeptidase AmpH [Providencia]|uniref:D-alanyl-D-alanine- carboxypeptidase/endopeptidase AmpH n=1 Tax=Providencia TaxID=586 RepID=UPI0003E27DDF|nr:MULTISPECIES: D-alanyl-D-alanine-carboxypeptidase/endopeptidase AmpH [Providencia]ETT02889.1 beta-lactamase [Providencia alcalifaciens PAL-3]EUC98891.1 beta-lactamase [Providencia alcalifaciens PAL-1]MTB47143.1 D-alanyl-D-alanine-carboxypeptidase/endopeptidase AmpH [Providencia sp. wls1950]QLR04522.1 D-alanyl-D-alanine-carboxypeptidase/endopeptidase AmpH [Providencia rettgeri]